VIGPKTAQSCRKAISVSDLAALPLVLGCRARTSRRLLDDAAANAGTRLNVDQEVDSQALLRSLVLHSNRYTVAPYGAFAGEIESNLLSARRICDPEIRQSVNAVYPASLPAPLEMMITRLIQVIVHGTRLPPTAVNLMSIAAE
jgi:LysR family nitrogen assimilation transcriptional regulator